MNNAKPFVWEEYVNMTYGEVKEITNISSGKYSAVNKLTFGDGSTMVAKTNDLTIFPVAGEVKFLQDSPVSPKLIDFSIEKGWMLMEYVENLQPTSYPTLGALTSQLHSVTSARYSRFEPGTGKELSYEGYSDLLSDYINYYTFDKSFLEFMGITQSHVDKMLELAAEYNSTEAVLTHGDLHSGNLLIADKGYLIDPAPERYMDVLWDFAMFKWQVINKEDGEQKISDFISGYGSDIDFKIVTPESILTDILIELSLDFNHFQQGGESPYREDNFKNLLDQI